MRITRVAKTPRQMRRTRRFLKHVVLRPRSDLVKLGGVGYGFWVVPESLIGTDSRCYLIGVGEDITFDLALIARFGCTVHAFDPTLASRRYVALAARHEPRFIFHPVGVWSSDKTLPFYAPAVEGWVSHSATNLQGTPVAFEAQVRTVSSLMRELGHERLDLLKVSAEGSEYEILRSLADDDVDARVICVEFAQPGPDGLAEEAYAMLSRRGYDLVSAYVRPWVWQVTFVKQPGDTGLAVTP